MDALVFCQNSYMQKFKCAMAMTLRGLSDDSLMTLWPIMTMYLMARLAYRGKKFMDES